MKNKIGLAFIVLLLHVNLISCNGSIDKQKMNGTDDTILQNKHKWLKDYALCSCIKYSFKDDTAIKNDLSFTVYKEISDYGNLSVYQIIDSASKKTARDIKPSQIADYGGKKALLNGCILYYESEKLDSLIKTFDKAVITAR